MVPFIKDKFHLSSFGTNTHTTSQQHFEDFDDDTPVSNTSVRESLQRENLLQVVDTDTPPWSAIYRFDSFLQGKQVTGGTGFLIGPRLLITAGHCLHLEKQRCWIDKVKVYRLKRDINENNATWEEVATSQDFRSTAGWMAKKNPDTDYGAIILPNDSLSLQSGWLGFGVIDEDKINKFSFHIAGYPQNEKGNSLGLFHVSDEVLEIHERIIKFSARSYSGMSGSPLWLLRSDGERIAFGIHHRSVKHDNDTLVESAIRITDKVFANLCLWLQESNSDATRSVDQPSSEA